VGGCGYGGVTRGVTLLGGEGGGGERIPGADATDQQAGAERSVDIA
jgi:hypothetical protein